VCQSYKCTELKSYERVCRKSEQSMLKSRLVLRTDDQNEVFFLAMHCAKGGVLESRLELHTDDQNNVFVLAMLCTRSACSLKKRPTSRHQPRR
jgi:hypothetical protein